MARVVGLELRAGTGEVDAESAELVRQRDDARANRDFARADALRDELGLAVGWSRTGPTEPRSTGDGAELRCYRFRPRETGFCTAAPLRK